MMLKRNVLLLLLVSLLLQAQEGELTLDPNDIPLPTDSTLDVPTDNTIQVPNLDDAVPEAPPVDPVAPIEPVAPQQAAPTAPPAAAPPTAAPQIEEFKPTPSNLEVKSPSPDDTHQKEERFTRTYSKFHKTSTSEQNWEKVVGKRTADTYIVNKGDTLWDISGTLFGDPFYWPKVWSLNKDLIYNPHVIFPDMKIKFYQGSSKATPTLATDNSAEKPVTDGAQATKTDVSAPVIPDKKDDDLPEDTHIAEGGIKLPKFFRDEVVSIKKNIEVLVEEHNTAPLETKVTQEFYLSEEPIAQVGTVVEIKNDFRSAGDGQFIYIKFDAQPEGPYTVLGPGKKLKADTIERPYNVEVYETEGEVKILGKVNSEENVYRALVVKSNTLVASGSIVVPGKMKTFKLSDALTETTAGRGRIIGNLSDYGIVGQGSFVVIDQGSAGGYQANMKLPVYEDLEGRRRHLKSLVKENPQRVGSVVIVDTTSNYSIGYISHIFDDISVNDIVASAEGGEFVPQSTKVDEGLNDSSAANPESSPEPTVEEAPVEEF